MKVTGGHEKKQDLRQPSSAKVTAMSWQALRFLINTQTSRKKEPSEPYFSLSSDWEEVEMANEKDGCDSEL